MRSRGSSRGVWLALVAASLVGCARDVAAPAAPPRGPLLGEAPPDTRRALLCGEWRRAVGYDREASSHTSFAELRPQQSCFVEVAHTASGARHAGVPSGCGFPTEATGERLTMLARRYDAVADGDARALPRELACPLSPGARATAARQNARALRSLAALAARGPLRAYPYAAVLVPGYGAAEQEDSRLVAAPPDAPCRALSPGELARLGVNVERARRAAEAYRGGVAPVVIVSGGAVHSPLVEAFALASLVRCAGGVPTERVLVDPCADHTHTNLRNLGALVVALGARTGYLVTDGGLQSAYLSDFTVFDVFGGSVDQRSLRDFGYLVGAWRRASRGLDGGFWYTPYRFWAEREPVTCLAPGGEASD